MSFQTLLKIKQNRLLSKTWRTSLETREIEKNNFHATGDLRGAREFAHAASVYKENSIAILESTNEPTVIYFKHSQVVGI